MLPLRSVSMKSQISSVINREITCLTVSLAFWTSTALIINSSFSSTKESVRAVIVTDPSRSPELITIEVLEIS